MTQICLYFQVHQPKRLRRLKAFHTPPGHDYWDEATNREIFERAANKCYLPANRLMLDLIRRTDGAFRIAYSISGTFLEQAEEYRPDVLESFRELARTGHVEFLSETYYHSLAGLWDEPREFEEQIATHTRAMQRLLGITPTTFRNTELIYDDRIASLVAKMGFQGILAEGAKQLLGDRSPNHVYRPAHEPRLRVLLKNYELSDDVAFRFSAHDWPGYPLQADQYANWLGQCPGDTINLFMDYETFGEHQWEETGIFDFLWHLPDEVARHPHLHFALPREVLRSHEPVGEIRSPYAVSWADSERDVSAWLGNRMQQAAFQRLKDLGPVMLGVGDPQLLHTWRLLQTSDHLYYASTKHMGDGEVHAYFSPYDSPYLAYINHVNAIEDLMDKAQERLAAPLVAIKPQAAPLLKDVPTADPGAAQRSESRGLQDDLEASKPSEQDLMV